MNHRAVMVNILQARSAEDIQHSADKSAMMIAYETALVDQASSIQDPKIQRKIHNRVAKGGTLPAAIREVLPEVNQDVLAKFEDVALKLNNQHWAYLDRTDKLLTRLAQRAIPKAGPETRVTSVSSTSYNSQGFGAGRYAESAARTYVDRAEQVGIKARVEREEVKYPSVKGSYLNFVVWAEVEGPVDVEILKRRDLNLREWMKSCWGRGVNPRVYNPFLPVGLEERLGLDYHGNDRKKKAF